MRIRETTPNDLESVFETYSIARQRMFESGNRTQWTDGYPPLALITEDIDKTESFVCVDEKDVVLGVFFYAIGCEPTYSYIEGKWINNETPYGFIHRIASNGKARGVARFCFDWSLKRFPNLRIDTHENNVIMQHILENYGFTKCGKIFLQNGEERIAYQIIKQ